MGPLNIVRAFKVVYKATLKHKLGVPLPPLLYAAAVNPGFLIGFILRKPCFLSSSNRCCRDSYFSSDFLAAFFTPITIARNSVNDSLLNIGGNLFGMPTRGLSLRWLLRRTQSARQPFSTAFFNRLPMCLPLIPVA